MQPKIVNLWIEKKTEHGKYRLQIDFDNDRHHLVFIQYPFETQEVAKALNLLARNIMMDPQLNGLSETNNPGNSD